MKLSAILFILTTMSLVHAEISTTVVEQAWGALDPIITSVGTGSASLYKIKKQEFRQAEFTRLKEVCSFSGSLAADDAFICRYASADGKMTVSFSKYGNLYSYESIDDAVHMQNQVSDEELTVRATALVTALSAGDINYRMTRMDSEFTADPKSNQVLQYKRHFTFTPYIAGRYLVSGDYAFNVAFYKDGSLAYVGYSKPELFKVETESAFDKTSLRDKFCRKAISLVLKRNNVATNISGIEIVDAFPSYSVRMEGKEEVVTPSFLIHANYIASDDGKKMESFIHLE